MMLFSKKFHQVGQPNIFWAANHQWMVFFRGHISRDGSKDGSQITCGLKDPYQNKNLKSY